MDAPGGGGGGGFVGIKKHHLSSDRSRHKSGVRSRNHSNKCLHPWGSLPARISPALINLCRGGFFFCRLRGGDWRLVSRLHPLFLAWDIIVPASI